jgi:hypothetical protein
MELEMYWLKEQLVNQENGNSARQKSFLENKVRKKEKWLGVIEAWLNTDKIASLSLKLINLLPIMFYLTSYMIWRCAGYGLGHRYFNTHFNQVIFHIITVLFFLLKNYQKFLNTM